MKKIVLLILVLFLSKAYGQYTYNGSNKHIFSTDYGVIEVGPFNNVFAHIYTDMPKIIFNKDVYTITNAFSSYNNDLIFKTIGIERLRINDQNGNVGIGVTNPLAQLHVSEGAFIRKTSIGKTIANNDNSWIRDDWLTGSYGPPQWQQSIKKWVRPGGTYNDIGGIVYQDEGTYFLRDRAGSKLEYTNTEFLQKAYLFANITTGDVGIGTNKPDSKLTVKGKIHAEEIKVDLAVPAPDYVFKEDYNLLSLEEVQQHIKEKGHLPNIPSAKEFEENGLELGVMNMKLLEKIEELTLYIIKQHKEIKNQAIKIKSLQSLEDRVRVIESKGKN
ncbi:MAG: hypothetical protein ACSHW4_09575 [Cellulophaga sp.]